MIGGEEPRCEKNGVLVNARGDSGIFPEDTALYAYQGSVDRIGCNRLQCSKCGAFVRQQAEIEIKPDLRPDPATLFGTVDWTTHAELKPDPTCRFYACRCGNWQEYSSTALSGEDPTRLVPPWSCAGHPPIELPYDLDGVVLEPDGAGLATVVREVLLGDLAPSGATERERAVPCSWVLKLYQLVARSSHADLGPLVSGAVRETFEAPSAAAETRARVLEFFAIQPEAPGADGPLRHFLAKPDQFVGVMVPKMSPPTLEDLLILCLNKRIRWLMFHGERLGPSMVDVIVRGLVAANLRSIGLRDEQSATTTRLWMTALCMAVECDNRAIAKRAEEIVEPSPTLAIPLLTALRASQSVRLLDVACRLAKVPGVDLDQLTYFGDQVGGQLPAALREL